jgi:predicted AlkP superfamily pyrophosphatase or phosphodiesterase
LVYLPHLDYPLQKDGPLAPNIPEELLKIDTLATDLIAFYEARNVRVLVLSEYGISPVTQQIHLNRLFRKKGWIEIKDELGLESIDFGASRVFAIADHQVAHIYVNDFSLEDEVRAMLENTPGVEEVRTAAQTWGQGIASKRGGEFIAIASSEAWFTYYFWEDDKLAPDYARTIDIHRKSGYDPCELFIDPEISLPKLRVVWFLIKKKLGFRGLLKLIPLNASLVKGSHGRDQVIENELPVLLGTTYSVDSAEDVHRAILDSYK